MLKIKKSLLFLIVLFINFSLFSQNRQEYLLELKQGIDLGIVQTSVNANETLTVTTNINDFSNFINSKSVYIFEKAFPTSSSALLQRVFVVTLDENESISEFYNRSEIEKFMISEELITLADSPFTISFPDDYEDLLYGVQNTALDLMKVPLAWSITTGDPNIVVGVVDTKYDHNHEDLIGAISDDKIIGVTSLSHGTSVAGIIHANTNNGVGIPGVAYNTTLVTASCNTATKFVDGLVVLSQYPGIRVINCSWVMCDTHPVKPYLDEAISVDIAMNDVLVVASAGNGPGSLASCGDGHGYAYPASYDSTLSVTSVGHRYPIGFANTDGWWGRSWEDVHLKRPDIPNTGSHTHNDKVDVTAPGQLTLSITDDYQDYPSGYYIGTSTSITAPQLTGVAGLVFSANPGLTASQVKDIIRDTADDINHISYNQPFIGLIGTGRINAYAAVLTAKCMKTPTPGLDLSMQNSIVDDFSEPDAGTQYVWRSEDIWIRNQNDGLLVKEHQNPEYDPNNPNYVYVRVTNSSCETSMGFDNLQLSWAKANTSLTWPNHWNGSLTVTDPITGQEILMGDEISTVSIPPLNPGQEAILEFEWYSPNPDDYINILNSLNDNPWHFCLLARIQSLSDPMTFTEVSSITENVTNNNNIAWKNTTIVDIIPDAPTPLPVGAIVAVGNPFPVSNTFNLEFLKETNEPGKAIYEEAEVTIEMDDVVYNAWQRGGGLTQDMDSTYVANKKIVTGGNAMLENIQFNPNEFGTISVSFNFLNKELTNKKEFVYHAVQKYDSNNVILGGETFEVTKVAASSFAANAGDDDEILKNETVTITAAQINEAAVYNWYDPNGILIYTGTNLTVSPNVTQTYKLEVISDMDGYKDYDEVTVTVKPYYIESLTPNPTSSLVTVDYMAEDASSAYLMVVNTTSGISNNYILDVSLNEATFDFSSYATGLYSVALVCDGDIEDSKLLVIE